MLVFKKGKRVKKYRCGWGVEEIETVEEWKYLEIWKRNNNSKANDEEGIVSIEAIMESGRDKMNERFDRDDAIR